MAQHSIFDVAYSLARALYKASHTPAVLAAEFAVDQGADDRVDVAWSLEGFFTESAVLAEIG